MTQLAYMPGNFKKEFRIPAEATAGAARVFALTQADAKIKIVGARWIPDAVVTGAATNNFALQVQNRGTNGAGTKAVTTAKTYDNGVNSVAADGEDLTITPVEADTVVQVGEVLALVRSVNGTGLASPAGTLELQFQYHGV